VELDGDTFSISVRYREQPKFCFVCGEEGHVKADCPEKQCHRQTYAQAANTHILPCTDNAETLHIQDTIPPPPCTSPPSTQPSTQASTLPDTDTNTHANTPTPRNRKRNRNSPLKKGTNKKIYEVRKVQQGAKGLHSQSVSADDNSYHAAEDNPLSMELKDN